MKKKSQQVLAMGLAAMMALTACGGSGSSTDSGSTTAAGSTEAGTTAETASSGPAVSESGSFQDTLHVAVTQQPPSLDLHKNSSLISRQIMDGAVFEKLVTLNSKAEAVPELAESYSLSEDAKTLTFKLRKGVMFHDGSEMTADDVVASMNRWIEGFSTAATMLGDARFTKVDDETVEITAETSLLLLPSMIAGSAQPAAITTAAACGNEDDNGFLKEYIGTGPYKFSDWQQDQYIKLEKFDDYVPYGTEGSADDGWSAYKTAPTKTLEYDIVPDQATETAGLESGQYDVIWNVTSDDYPRLEANPDITTTSSQMGSVALIFNHKEGLGAEQYIRTAVNTAANCDEILTAGLGTGYELGSCYMDAGQVSWQSDAGSENYNIHDTEKAKQLLADGGYNGETFRILAASLNGMDKMAVALKSELEAIGMTVDLNIVDWATLTDYRKDSSLYDLYVTTFAEVPVPSLKLYYGTNYPGWSVDDKLQSLFTDMTSATNMEDAKAAWDELQGYSWEYLPLICPGHYLGMFAWKKDLQGVNMYSGGPKLWNAGIPA